MKKYTNRFDEEFKDRFILLSDVNRWYQIQDLLKDDFVDISAENQYKVFEEMNEKLTKWHLREKTKFLLSLPIPMSYEIWSELHRYLEELDD
ncbi:MAG: hypothetical protein J6A15_00480 [Clostridia bacterium]|nr:hypothetical protein [Clostridia bacterium]